MTLLQKQTAQRVQTTMSGKKGGEAIASPTN
jgi:hypothetical protein